MNEFQDLIKEICDELGIHMTILSNGWIIVLEKDNKTSFIEGYRFNLNRQAISAIMNDKYATYEVLMHKGIPVIEHKLLYNKDNRASYAQSNNNYADVEDLFQRSKDGIVIKANNGTCGREVLRITKKEEISHCLDSLFQNNLSLSYCPFYDIKSEYRLIILDNKCELMYGKRRPKVVGDGKKTVRELLLAFNSYYFANKLDSKDYDRVLFKGEEYEYSWKFNLSCGAIPFEIEDEKVKAKLLEILSQIRKTINLDFCSIDIVETRSQEFLVLEINSGIMIHSYCHLMHNGRKDAKRIYKKAIEKMFE